MNTFGEFFKKKRSELGIPLRQFCLKFGLDPGNISKLERDLIPPPQGHKKLEEYASYLKIKKNSDDWFTFCDLAAAGSGKIPEELLKKRNVVDKLPLIFRTLRGKKISDKQLKELMKIIKGAS
jgi:transcriptional regulator with XRE-family HTH domain